VAQDDATFGHSAFVWMLQTNLALMLPDPGLDGMASLSSVDLTTLAVHIVHITRLQSLVILHRP
jgi:hypothetical protein